MWAVTWPSHVTAGTGNNSLHRGQQSDKDHSGFILRHCLNTALIWTWWPHMVEHFTANKIILGLPCGCFEIHLSPFLWKYSAVFRAQPHELAHCLLTFNTVLHVSGCQCVLLELYCIYDSYKQVQLFLLVPFLNLTPLISPSSSLFLQLSSNMLTDTVALISCWARRMRS